MSDQDSYYRKLLKAELARRKAVNPRYSIRAFASALKLNNGYLSKVISGKVMLTVETANEVSTLLKLNKVERDQFIISVADEQKCSSLYGVDPLLTDCDEEC